MAVLVTGGAGYSGSHTAVALHDAGRHVVVLDDLSNSSPAAVDALRSLTRPDLPFVEADAADVDAVGRTLADHGVDEVVHFLSRIHISEPKRLLSISYAVFCLKKKTQHHLFIFYFRP